MIVGEGIVTLSPQARNEPASYILLSSLSGRQPSIHRRCTVGAVRSGRCQVALDVEGVVDSSVSGEESLGRAPTFKSLHLAFSSPRWLVRVFCSVVTPSATLMAPLYPKVASRCSIRPQIIRDQQIGNEAILLEQLAHQL